MKTKSIAIITARGGSKRIPRKNIRSFLGKPIIEYSIKAALESKNFSVVMVSTDDEEIAEVARKCGAEVPFLRSKKNSDDYSTTVDVLFEVLDQYKEIGQEFDYFCCIYPTAPFVTSEKLNMAIEILINNETDTVFPITKFGFPIQRALKIENGFTVLNQPQYLNSRSQDLEPMYHDCGQFYFMKTKPFYEKKKVLTNKTMSIVVPETEVQDIDNEEDWKIAELKYQLLKKENE